MRGKREGYPRFRRRMGLIPAYAGKTSVHVCRDGTSQAHPRVCGENVVDSSASSSSSGSSPRMRGKRRPHNRGNRSPRLIPAYAGKTAGQYPASQHTPAHPRVCGENAIALISSVVGFGSSPRMRGKLTNTGEQTGDRGLIPAYAGKTWRK